ncbi:MAG: PilN domain-containing protein [Candidatus Moranbacteria bacterium]|nr:PilN domain-containing protein [Candidatus Moranbacteria bacterium]
MPGVNLSQSIVEKSAYQAKSGGEKGRLIVFGLFCLTLFVWGGVWLGVSFYERKIVTTQEEIEAKKVSFGDSGVSDVADVDARLALVNQKKANQVYPKTVLTGLEATILPLNHLTSFEYDFTGDTIEISGVAPGYKEVAQQLMAFKASPLFSNTVLSGLSREKDNDNPSSGVTFEVTTVWSKKN